MTTLPISNNTFSYIIFDFLKDIFHSFPQVWNLGRRISQKNNNKNTNRRAELPKSSHKQLYDN